MVYDKFVDLYVVIKIFVNRGLVLLFIREILFYY